MSVNSLTITERFPEKDFTLLIPIKTVSEIAEIHKPVMNVVNISTDLEDKEIYEQEKGWSDKNGVYHEPKYALTKRGLTKLMKAAGIKMLESKPILPSTCQKCADVNRNLNTAVNCYKCGNKDVKYTVSLNVPQLTGENINIIATKEIIVEEALSSMTEKEIKGFLKFKAEICESKALNRALRNAMNVKGVYTINELKKPFVVAYLVPNLNQPDVRQAAITNMVNSSVNLFGKSLFEDNKEFNIEGESEGDILGIGNGEGNADIENKDYYEGYPIEKHVRDKLICKKCGAEIDKRVYAYSIKFYKFAYCRKCQKNEQKKE